MIEKSGKLGNDRGKVIRDISTKNVLREANISENVVNN